MSAAVRTTGSGVAVLKLAPEYAIDKVLRCPVMRDVQLSGNSHIHISNSCIISSTVYLSFEAIIALELVFVCNRCINCNTIIIL